MTVNLQPRLSGYGRVKPLNRRDRRHLAPQAALGSRTIARALRAQILFAALGKHAIHGGAAYTKGGSNSPRRLTASVHPLRQSGFRLVECLRSSDVLPACPTRLACCRPPLTTQLQLKLRKAGQDARHHPARRIRGVDALAQRPQNDAVLPKLADRRHDLSSVAAQAVDADDNYRVALAGIIQQCGKSGALLPCRSPRQLVAVNP